MSRFCERSGFAECRRTRELGRWRRERLPPGDVLGLENFLCGGLKFLRAILDAEFVFFSCGDCWERSREGTARKTKSAAIGVCAFCLEINADGEEFSRVVVVVQHAESKLKHMSALPSIPG